MSTSPDDSKSHLLNTPGTYNALALPAGHLIHDYKIQSTLGGGGFGITYLARDTNLNLPVAIKEYLPSELAMRGADLSVKPSGERTESQFNWGLERFLDEARTLATFRHPNIVRVLRYFQAHGTAYIVMEYESGESLRHWLPRHTPVDCQTLTSLIHPLLDGLELIHKAGFLHRDIKPDNIYIRRDGTPVLLDFGAARRITTGNDLTTVITPGFAPFEQYHAHGNQGPWTDIYAMAAVMYWLVGNEKPMDAAARTKVDSMVPATSVDRHSLYPRAYLEALDWALKPDEGDRPQSIDEFRRALFAAAQQAATGADPTLLNSGSTQAVHATLGGRPTPSFLHTESRRNVVCTVMQLAIPGYADLGVNEQVAQRDQLQHLLNEKLSAFPEASRIVLNTAEGGAICFLGDPEDVLLTTIDLQRSLQRQSQPQSLRLRIGVHMGPIRVFRDLNGRDNVIGDGLNTAARVMDCANLNEVLVSHAFYDVVSCLSERVSAHFQPVGEHADAQGRAIRIFSVSDLAGAEAADERTIPLGQPRTAAPTVAATPLDAQAVIAIERELTRLMGPLAAILVRKAVPLADSLESLRSILAQSLTDETQRQAFIAGATPNSRTGSNSKALSGRHSTGQPSATVSSRNTSPSMSRTLAGTLDADSLALVERALTHAIGPIAKALLKREMRSHPTLVPLCQALAQHIDHAGARERFLQDVQSKDAKGG